MYQKYAKLRDAKGVTDAQVARETGILSTTLSEWKHGKYTPKADKLLKLANYFGVPLETFYDTL